MVSFGLAVPAFASPGANLFRTPGLLDVDAALCLAVAREAEASGFDSLWSCDHLMIGRDEAVLEGWTLLSAITGATSRVRLGLIQQSNLFRAPAQFAKAAATLDRISGGRFTFFSNFGAKESEHRAYGVDWPADEAERIARLGEALHIMRRLWRESGPVDHAGRFYALNGAVLAPKPVRPDGPPLWFAGTQPEHLRNLAPIADGWCTPPVPVDEFRARLALIHAALAEAGRPPDALEIAFETQILVAEDTAALRRSLAAIVALDRQGTLSGRPPLDEAGVGAFLDGRTEMPPASLTERWIVGTPDAVVERFRAYMAAGANHFILWFMDLPERSSLKLFNEAVAPRLRGLEPDRIG
jgi:alkanesulfonate monooxygenase SsuD/methylene tetrahydromethanopterin reductase-like flavin-dependent oxidoreductase (luciferase family)